MVLLQVITEIVFGALTGYVTNDFAIRELFKKGGIVEKTRDDFTKEISDLLEQRVLTVAVLQEKLESPEVQLAIEKLLYNFLMRDFPKQLENEGVSLWQHEKIQVEKYLQQGLQEVELISAAQKQKLVESLSALVLEELAEGEYFKEALANWRVVHTGQTLGETEWCDLVEQVVPVLADKLEQVKDKWFEKEKIALQEEVSLLFAEFEVVDYLISLSEKCMQKSIQNYLPVSSKEITEKLLAYLQSEQGEAVLVIIIEKLLCSLYEVKLSLGEILPTQQIGKANPFLMEQLEELLEAFLGWLEKNKYILSVLIEEAVNDVFSEYEGVQGVVLHYVKENFITEFIRNYDFAKQFQEDKLEEKTAHEILQQAENYLLVRPLGEVLQQLLPLARGKELLLPMLKENLIFYLTNYGEQQIKQVLEYPLSHWVGDYLSKAKIEKFVNALENYLLDYLEQIDVESLAAKAQAKLLKQEVEVIFSEQNLDNLQEIVVKEAASFGGYLKEKLDLLTIDDFLAYLKGVELQEVYSEFLTNEQAELLVAKGQEIILEHFVAMSRGSLSKLAKEKLDSLSNEEMLVLVQEFMGSKLKTLNYLGAGMGSLVGLTAGIGLTNFGNLGLSAGLLPAGGYAVGKTFIFGALGYGTNCAAIKGLFWPYYPVAGQDWLQGIIPRQKKSFAHFMGEMVNEYVVNEEIFQQIVVDYRSEATGQIIKASDSLEINIEEALLKLGEQPLYKFYPACLGDLGSKYYPKLCQKVYDNGKEFLKSDVSLEKIVSETQIWQYFEKMLLEMNLPEFKNYWQYILNEKTTATLKEQLVQILLDKLQEEATSQKIARWSNQFFQKEYVGTAFNGQLTFWVEHNLQKMMQFFISKIMELLREKQEIVTTAIQGSIINRLSLLQQLGYSMINGNKLVGEVVEKIITEKIPAFLSMKQNEIADVVMAFWQTKLVQLPLRELQIEITPEAVQALIKQILQQEMIHEGKKELLALLGEQFPQVSIQTLLQELQLEQELADVQKWLDQHWQEEKGELLAWCDLHCRAYGQEMWSGTKLQELFLPWAEVELTADWFEQQLAAFKLEQISLDFYENMLLKVGRKSGQEIILWQNLTTNIVALLEYCLTDDEIGTWLLRMREEIIELVVGAVFRSLEQDGAKILQEMNLSALTEEQVLAMEAEELEAMVWRFARHYLIHIQNMGWMGAVFAIPGILLTFLM